MADVYFEESEFKDERDLKMVSQIFVKDKQMNTKALITLLTILLVSCGLQKPTGEKVSQGTSVAIENQLGLGVSSKSQTGIRIREASYGVNCGASPNNVAGHISALCNGRSSCTYAISHTTIGDPVFGCEKSYEVTYSCSGSQALKSASAGAEASGSQIELNCPATTGSVGSGQDGTSRCGEFEVRICNSGVCRCLASGAAPESALGNALIDIATGRFIGPLMHGSRLLISSLGAIRIVQAPTTSGVTFFGKTAIDLTKHKATVQTLEKARSIIKAQDGDFAFEYVKKSALNTISAKLNLSEMAGINYYTRFGYAAMNNALRESDEAVLKNLQPLIEAVSSGLNKMTGSAFRGHVYRGASLSSEVSAAYSVGARVVEKAFTSTTRNASRAFDGNTYFTIRSASGKMIDSLSSLTGEAEVLFPPGTVFKVLSRHIDGAKTKIFMEQIVP